MNTFDDLSSYFRNIDRSTERPLPARRMQIMREIISNYNENVRLNNQQMMEYHQNMREILDMVRSFPDLQTRASSIPTPTPSRNTNRLNIYPELSTLLYLLSNTTIERQQSHRTESLSRMQIQSATRNIHYTTDLSYNVCPISLEDFVENEEVCQIKQCGHIFKKNSIMRWFSASHVHCPVCRYDLRNYQEPNNNDSDEGIEESRSEPIEPDTSEVNNNNTTSENRNTRYVQDISGIFTNLYEQLFLNNIMDSDSSGNLVYTFEFPLYYANYR
jgi:hypothetical protein